MKECINCWQHGLCGFKTKESTGFGVVCDSFSYKPQMSLEEEEEYCRLKNERKRMSKEYICLQELNEILDKRIAEERITERVLSDIGHGIELASILADSLPTVTKVDICREFAKKVEKHTFENCHNLTCRRKQYEAYKIGICREFADKLKSSYKKDYDLGMVATTYEACISNIDDVLAEMEE